MIFAHFLLHVENKLVECEPNFTPRILFSHFLMESVKKCHHHINKFPVSFQHAQFSLDKILDILSRVLYIPFLHPGGKKMENNRRGERMTNLNERIAFFT